MVVDFVELYINDTDGLTVMGTMAAAIWREHYDDILGKEQVDYMIELFQSPKAIASQLRQGYRYFFAVVDGRAVGFLAIIAHEGCIYLSKLYLYAAERRKGYGRQMVSFVAQEAQRAGYCRIELNVNRFNESVQAYERMGFHRVHAEVNDIGHGYVMDDYVYALDL